VRHPHVVHDGMHCIVKLSLLGGKTTPCDITLIEDFLTQAKKTPKPLSHPYIRATQTHVSAGPATVATVGQGLNLCFDMWRGEGIFLTRAEIHS
jgi:hypothetical protein